MMDIIHTLTDLNKHRENAKNLNQSVGLVPTMGNLHEGHLSLLATSIEENDLTIITIFVNPKQFGPNEDFGKYPRTLDQDISKITNTYFELSNKFENKSVLVFAPQSDKEIYPDGFSTTISVGSITQILCGKFRPTHFDGVTTVVYRLFKITDPTIAYFGQKDYQQCVVINKMIHDLGLNIKTKIMPIIRNSNGLALSSRNQYLSEEEKNNALYLHQTLNTIKSILLKNEMTLQDRIQMASNLRLETLKDTRFDYLEFLDANELSEINNKTNKVVILGVLRLSGTRLLDNEVIEIHAR